MKRLLEKQNYILPLLLALLLSGCSTSQKQLLPVDEQTTMLNIWNRQTSGNASLYDQRSQLRRSPQPVMSQQGYTRTATNEINAQFKRLPNPDLVMYVFPHLTDGEPTPVPGYSTVFPFFTRVQYAMPGERAEAL